MATTQAIREWYLENEIEDEEILVDNDLPGHYTFNCTSPSVSMCGILELDRRGNEMYLYNFHAYVTRVGIGTRLMQKALEVCDELQLPCILIVTPGKLEIKYDDLLRFYLEFGFQETTRRMYCEPIFIRMPNLR